MAAEAEAAREARAKVEQEHERNQEQNQENKQEQKENNKTNGRRTTLQVIAAEGEQKASSALREAAEVKYSGKFPPPSFGLGHVRELVGPTTALPSGEQEQGQGQGQGQGQEQEQDDAERLSDPVDHLRRAQLHHHLPHACQLHRPVRP